MSRDAFIARKQNGLSLSDRVWRYTEGFKTEMEMGLDLGIRSGKSADQISRDLRQYLQHPDMLFRRVRDEHGILHLSQRAKAFHPGQGVYRSSYLNARRLAVTETNTAYRTADHERWQDMDFVVGIEIHLSGNHTCKGRDGKPHRFTDICDELAGRYPKDFKFTGWHPHCRCYATSILKTEEEMAADTQKLLKGEKVSGESENAVKDVPDNFKEWVEDNKERIAESKSQPHFIKDNHEYVTRQPDIVVGSAAMPPSLGVYEQRAWNNNENKVTEKLNLEQGWIMTHEEANALKGNPNFGKSEEYNINCQSCVVAYELRRRGFDVEAMPRFRNDPNDIPQKLALKIEMAWKDVDSDEMPQRLKAGGAYYDKEQKKYLFKTDEQVLEDFNEITKEKGRYHMFFSWKGKYREGHIICVERLNNGQIRLYDPQSGKTFDWDYIEKKVNLKDGLQLYRVDNLLINEEIIGGVVRHASQ